MSKRDEESNLAGVCSQATVSSLPGPEIDITVGFGLGLVNQEPDPC